jgi:hypothetical protein
VEPYYDYEYSDETVALCCMSEQFFSAHVLAADYFWSDTHEGKQHLTDLSNEENQ